MIQKSHYIIFSNLTGFGSSLQEVEEERSRSICHTTSSCTHFFSACIYSLAHKLASHEYNTSFQNSSFSFSTMRECGMKLFFKYHNCG